MITKHSRLELIYDLMQFMLFFHCGFLTRWIVVELLLNCCWIVVELLLNCFRIVVELLLNCCWTIDVESQLNCPVELSFKATNLEKKVWFCKSATPLTQGNESGARQHWLDLSLFCHSKRCCQFCSCMSSDCSHHHWYSVFQGFRQAKSAHSDFILSSRQLLILPQLPQKMRLASKVVKVYSKIIISLPKI